MIELVAKDITGLILAGGEGRRMDNRDKGLVTLVDKSLVQYAIECLQPLTHTQIISCNRNRDAYQAYGLPLIADDERWSLLGPMAGIYSGLKAIESDWLMVMPCDTPLMQIDVMALLKQLSHDCVKAHILAWQGWEPLHAVYHKDLLPLLEHQLNSGRTGMQHFLHQLEDDALQISEITSAQNAFRNTNNVTELSQVEEILRGK